VKVDRTLVIPLLRGLTRTLGSRGEKGVGSVRLRIVEGYVFYLSTVSCVGGAPTAHVCTHAEALHHGVC
jgi:hypothetical protein